MGYITPLNGTAAQARGSTQLQPASTASSVGRMTIALSIRHYPELLAGRFGQGWP